MLLCEVTTHSLHGDKCVVMLVQGVENEGAAERDSQVDTTDADAQNSLCQGPPAHPPSAQHPLASLLSDLHYAPWQLEATPPQAPKVGITNIISHGSMIHRQSSRSRYDCQKA